MSTSDREAPRPLSMRDLLASCAAATAVSTPPAPGHAENAEAARTGPAAQAEAENRRDAA